MAIRFPSRLATPSAAPLAGPRPRASAFAASRPSQLEAHASEVKVLAMDVAGSGRADLVQIWSGSCGELHATTYLAAPASGGVAYRRVAEDRLGSFGHQFEILAGDVDGDGRADLIVAYAGGAGRELRLATFLSRGEGFSEGGVFATGEPFNPRHLAFFTADVHGDGRTGVVEAYQRREGGRDGLLTFRTFASLFGDGDRSFAEAVVAKTWQLARPAGELLLFAPPTASEPGSGLVRVYRRAGDDRVIAEVFRGDFAEPVVSDLGVFSLANDPAFFLADVDGDGLPDLIQAFTEVTENGSRLHLTTFFGRAEGRFVAGPASHFENAAAGTLQVLAAPAGRSPLLIRRFLGSGGRLIFATYRATQAGSFRQGESFDAGAVLPGVASALYLAGDADGDGRDDLIRLRRDAAGGIEALPYLAREPQLSRDERPAAERPFRLRPARRLGSESAAGG